MTIFGDGPAKGQTLMLKRAPLFLRVVEANGKWDALDQLDDQPEPGEKIYAYERVGKSGIVHLNFGSGRGGWYPMASYRVLDHQPSDSDLRENERWQRWCREQMKKTRPHPVLPPEGEGVADKDNSIETEEQHNEQSNNISLAHPAPDR